MILSRVYPARQEIPRGAETLYEKRGELFIMKGATRDFVSDNPWEMDNWNLTAQGRFISQFGMALANAFAKNAGTTIGGSKPKATVAPRDLMVLIQRRNIGGTTNNSSSTGGFGSAGEGDPS